MLTERDQINLQKLLQLYNFSQLRPPPDVYQINIPQQKHFVEIGQNKKRRFIFYKVPYKIEQQQKIAEVKSKLLSNNIYQNYSSEIILKHLYTVQFDIKKCIERLQKLQAFQSNQIVTTLSKQTILKLKSGCIYSYGHDHNMKPIVIIRADKFDYSLSIEQSYNPVYFLMLVVLGFRNVPYHAEKYINIFDFCDMKMTEIPYKYLFQVFTSMNLYYCGNTQNTYVFNAKGIATVWRLAQNIIPQHTKKKIIFIDQKNKQQILKQIDPLQLQKRYGGKLENLKQYWPPKSTNQQFDAVQMLRNKNKSEQLTESQFYSVCNNEQYFQSNEGICGTVNCGNCNIF